MSILRPNGTQIFSARVLDAADLPRLAADLPDSPLAAQGDELAKFSGVLLVFEDSAGRIVAHWPLLLAWHAEPCYVHPDFRGSGDLVNQMIDGLKSVMAAMSVPIAFASADEPAVARILGTLGFQRVPGQMYYAHAEGSAPPADRSAPPQESPR